jgi:ribonuclease R
MMLCSAKQTVITSFGLHRHVAHYVEPPSALDQEAYSRGTSVYFPDRAIPMLPEALSNGICSLNPNEDRLTKTVAMEINGRGEVVGSRFFDSVIRSQERMTYTAVRRILVDRDQECLERYRDLVDQFKLMEELALLLYAAARPEATDFDLPGRLSSTSRDARISCAPSATSPIGSSRNL